MAEQREAIRVGLVGCGTHGRALAEGITRADSLQLVACADPDEAARRRAGALSAEVNSYKSLDELLDASDVDAVVIATPHHLLGPTALTAIRAGKHVLVEKPMAMNEKEAKEIEFAAASIGVNCMAGYSFRFSMMRYMHEVIEEGAVGDIQAITGAIGHGPMTGWLASPETGGGPLLYVGCHLIDILLWFMQAEPASVTAQVNRSADTGADESSAIQIGFNGGQLAQVFVTQAAAAFFYDLHVYGRSGTIALRGRNFLQFEVEVQSNTVARYREPTVIRPLVRRDNISMMLVPELEEFARSVEEGRPPAITASDGRRVLRVLDAVIDSARGGERVALGAPVLSAF
jgi:predicted dehydrogenase